MNKGILQTVIGLIGLAMISNPLSASDRLEKNFSLEPGGRFRLETGMGRVRVTGVSRSGARMTVVSRGRDLADLLTFQFDESPHSVTVIAKSRHHLFFSSDASVEFEIEVPAETSTDIHTSGGAIEISSLRAPAKLDTSGGSISVTELAAELTAHTSGGSIHLRDIQGNCRVGTSGGSIEASDLQGSLHAETSGGSIHLEAVKGDADVHSSGGGIKIHNAGGRVEAETSGGSIDASLAKGNSRGGSFESSGGGITVAVDPQVGLTIDAEGDHVHTDLPLKLQGDISRRSLRGDLGSGGERLRLRASGGGIRLVSI